MGLATRLGPWLLGTVKNTTGTTVGTITNLGAATVVQSRPTLYTETTAQTRLCILPAGSQIITVQYIITTAYTTTAPTFTMFINGTQASSAIALSTTGGGLVGAQVIPMGGNSAAGATLVANCGPVDATLAFTQSNGGGGTGAGVLLVEYVVRNPNGTYLPAYNEA